MPYATSGRCFDRRVVKAWLQRSVAALFCVTWTGLGVVGCGSGAGSDGFTSTTPPTTAVPADDDSRWHIETSVHNGHVTAGDALEVTCQAFRDGAPAALEMIVDAERMDAAHPEAHVATSDVGMFVAAPNQQNAFIANPTVAGAYAVHCRAAKRAVSDPVGAPVVVVAGAATGLDTVLDAPTARAGIPATVTCNTVDRYGNFIRMASDARLETPTALTWRRSFQAGSAAVFEVSATLVGSYSVACVGSVFSDAVPAVLRIVPGPAAAVSTQVTTPEVRANEWVQVNCQVRDAFGNAASDVPTTFAVIAANGQPASLFGFERGVNRFRVTRTGSFRVACVVTGASVQDPRFSAVMVRPGLPFSWTPHLLQQACYWQGHALPLDLGLVDTWGNAIDDSSIRVSSTPANGVTYTAGKGWVVTREADYDITMEVTGDLAPGNTIVPFSMSLRSDSTPPDIIIDQPARASMVLSKGSNTVPILGMVRDGLSPLTSVTVNGIRQPVVAGASTAMAFESTQEAVWGVNVITAVAEDSCANRRVIAQSYLKSDTYGPVTLTPSTTAAVHNGMLGFLKQALLDDGDRRDMDDFVSVIQAVLNNMDLGTMLPDTLAVFPDTNHDGEIDETTIDCFGLGSIGLDFAKQTGRQGVRIERACKSNEVGCLQQHKFHYRDPELLEISLAEGKVRMRVAIGEVFLPLQISARTPTCFGTDATLPLQSTISISNGARVGLELEIDVSHGIPVAHIRESCRNAQGVMGPCLTIAFDCGSGPYGCPRVDTSYSGLSSSPVWSWLPNVLNGAFNIATYVFQSQLNSEINSRVRAMAPGMIEDFIRTFRVGADIVMPQPLSTHLYVTSGLDEVHMTGEWGSGIAQTNLFAQFYPAQKGARIPVTARGPITRPRIVPQLDLTQQSTFGIAIADDVMNHALWAAWYGGALDVPDVNALMRSVFGESAVVKDIDLAIRADAPPVVMPGHDGYDVEVGMGDMYMHVKMDLDKLMGTKKGSGPSQPVEIGMYVSGKMQGRMRIDNVTNTIKTEMDPDHVQIYIQIVEMSDIGNQFEASDTMTTAMKELMPRWFNYALLSVPIPVLDLRMLSPLAPTTAWHLDGGEVHRSPTNDYTIITGGLRL